MAIIRDGLLFILFVVTVTSVEIVASFFHNDYLIIAPPVMLLMALVCSHMFLLTCDTYRRPCFTYFVAFIITYGGVEGEGDCHSFSD